MSEARPLTITFLPSGHKAEVQPDTVLIDAAAAAGVDVEAECGGKGTCGSCLMEIEPVTPNGEVVPGARPRLVYGCREIVETDLRVTPLASQAGRRIVADSSYLVRCRTQLASGDLRPICRDVSVELSAPSAGATDVEQLQGALTGVVDGDVPSLDLQALQQVPEAIRAAAGRVTASLWTDVGQGRITDIRPGHGGGRSLGIACDLGTSTVVVQLIDLGSGKVLASAADYNRQVRSGADVVSRIDRAGRAGGLDLLREQAMTTLAVLLRRVCEQASVSSEAIRAMVVAGNTTMSHLLLGVQPRFIREEPYVPVFDELASIRAQDLSLELHPTARVYCVPGVGGFVGGDIVAGVLCQIRCAAEDEVSLFIDIGTNGEIVLAGDGWRMTCACSAGPAFEGSGVGCGMRAAAGAIERIELDDQGEVARFDVIGGGPPRGVCGSGLIQLLGELLRVGMVDRGGHFTADTSHPRITRFGRHLAYVVARGQRTRDDLILSGSDIENLVRTKAAIYSGCALLLRNVGLEFGDLDRVYVAGGFGQTIAVDHAVAIGLLPDVGADRFTFLGNTSLAGARLCLLSTAQRDQALAIARSTTYVELSTEPAYMDEYTAALFLPHTDLSRFPSVQ